MSLPRVSICSQVLNNSVALHRMVKSVCDQTFKDWELVIVDDGSTEDLQAVVDTFNDSRIKLIRLEANVGVPKGINRAMKEARGEYLGLLASDEFITPEKLEIQVAYMDEHKGVDCTWGLPGKGEFGERPLWEQSMLRAHNRSNEHWLRDLLAVSAPIGGASLLMKRSVMESLGYMDENLVIFSDHELYCRFFKAGHVGVVLPYRWADESKTAEKTQREINAGRAESELKYVRDKHALMVPKATGKVTVGIPSFNHAKYLKESVGSVLAQTHQDIEILILNDGGTDNFTDVVREFTDQRIKVMAFPENMGVWEAQNQMAFRATGEFYVPFAADDILEPTYIERCLQEFQNNPWLEMVCCHTDFVKEDGSDYNTPDNPMANIPKITAGTREEMLVGLHPGNKYHGVGMYRTKVISDLGGWEKQYKVIADYQMYLKLLQREAYGVIPEYLVHTRVDGKNLSLLDKARAAELPHLYHAARKPYFKQLMKVIIATPFYELKGFSPYIQSLQATIRLLTQCGIDWRFMDLSGDSYVHRARNTMCDVFLQDPDATDLFFIDSDMSWNPEAFVRMCMLPEEVVGGSYPVKNHWQAWTSLPMPFEENGQHIYKGRELGDGTALIEALVIAGGFMRLKRSVLEKFRKSYPDLWYREGSSSPDDPEKRFTQFFGAEAIDHQFYGEDHMFSKKLREMGTKLYIYPNVDIVHWGYKNFPGNYDQYLRAQVKKNGTFGGDEPMNPDKANIIDTRTHALRG
jgi:glycosyltransferase involved in cell wall biosynthesis